MSKSPNQKLKLLYLYQILTQRSDEEHPITVPELIAQLQRHDIKAERKSIYDDLEALRLFGLDVQNRKGSSPGWFVGRREFELPELKLLVDAVQSSRFITKKKSDALIRKLEGLASTHQARQLQRQVYVSQRIKVMNESIYYNVDKLHAAIAGHKVITFRYFDYNVRHEKVFRREGGRYTVSPYGLIWNNENYYLVAYEAASQQMRHYRVDKMAGVTVLDEPRRGKEQFADLDLPAYLKKHFQMFGGPEYRVTLRCTSDLESAMRERFGASPIFVPEGKEHFHFDVPVCVSDQFYGWVCGFGGKIEVVSPAEARDGLRALNERLVKMHQ